MIHEFMLDLIGSVDSEVSPWQVGEHGCVGVVNLLLFIHRVDVEGESCRLT